MEKPAIYLSTEKYSQDKLQPENQYFINVIDTYLLKGSYNKQKLYFILSDDIKEKILKETTSYFYVSILYRGNLSPDKKESKNAGKLKIGSISLLEIN